LDRRQEGEPCNFTRVFVSFIKIVFAIKIKINKNNTITMENSKNKKACFSSSCCVPDTIESIFMTCNHNKNEPTHHSYIKKDTCRCKNDEEVCILCIKDKHPQNQYSHMYMNEIDAFKTVPRVPMELEIVLYRRLLSFHDNNQEKATYKYYFILDHLVYNYDNIMDRMDMMTKYIGDLAKLIHAKNVQKTTRDIQVQKKKQAMTRTIHIQSGIRDFESRFATNPSAITKSKSSISLVHTNENTKKPRAGSFFTSLK